MPLTTNQTWNIENARLEKRPLYYLLIDGVMEPLTTFRADDAQITWGGYGMGGYGTTGYGY